ncbi:glycosyltransferase family 2 protein [Polynucleobacter sinensis]|uniref:glycosyltransferase family 2 protein n=1 Tax=Polynucleobacter sinensis TaxID=1743157 RepID=UPI0007813D8C|nr:glycosyltransferase family 2 protein [Polynucleobacter sinensis]
MTFPFASVIFLTYNQEHFVEEAFLSLLNQDTDNIEIIVSDDSSSDDTWGKIQKVASEYQGPKKIILARNPTNVGIVTNYAKAFEKSSGELIFMAAGDDISLPERCSQSIRFWMDGRQKYDLVAADALDMGYDGTVLGFKENSDLEHWTIEKWFERRPYFFGQVTC